MPDALPITHDHIRFIMPYARNIANFIDPLNDAANRFEINTPRRLAAWLANLAHESGEFRYMEEIADGSAYDSREDLGNLDPEAIRVAKAHGSTAGRWFKGHGPIQITGYYNHRDCGEYLGIDAVNEPRLLATPIYGCLAAGWFWEPYMRINRFADLGDFDACCDLVNLGRRTPRVGDSNHYAQRLAYYNRALSLYQQA